MNQKESIANAPEVGSAEPIIGDYDVLTDLQGRRCRAALALLGEQHAEFSERKGISKYRLSRMLSGGERLTPSYAKALNELLSEAAVVRREIDAQAA